MDQKIKLSEIRAKFPMYGSVSDEDLVMAVRRRFFPNLPMSDFAQRIEFDTQRPNPTEGMSGFDRFAAGAGKAIVDTGRGLRQLANPVMDVLFPNQGGSRVEEGRQAVADSRALDAPLMDTGAGMAGNVAGNVAMALAPGGVLKGAGVLAKAGGAADLAGALSRAGGVAMAPTSIPAAAGVGAAQGFVQPSASGGETLGNTLVGTAASAAMPVAMRAGQVAKAAIDPFSQSGQAGIIGRAINAAAGDSADDAMRNLRGAGELVPGSMPTAGEAAANPGIAALQRTATATDPVAMNALAARQAGNNDARLTALRDIAGTDGKREFFQANRDATANQMYSEARRLGIDPAALTPEAQANIAAFQARIPDSVLAEAQQLAKIHGETMGPEGSVQGLHWIKKGLDSLIGRESGPNGSADFLRAYMGLKNDLMAGIENLSPKYAEANQTYAAMSRPINQMDVAGELLKKSVRPIDDQLLPGMYARNLNDDLAARVTGIRSNTLGKVMEPQQLSTMNAVKDDLARKQFSENAGRGVGSDTVQKLAYSNIMAKSGLPGFMKDVPGAGILGRMADLGYKRSNDEMSRKLAQALLNPQETATYMEKGIMSPEVERALFGVKRGGAAIGAATPYLLNAGKE